jgi:predicted acylesterase/phospholipase RssA
LQQQLNSGTSIGAVNAAIITTNASYDDDSTIKNSARELEKFWLELAEVLSPIPYEYSTLCSYVIPLLHELEVLHHLQL